MASVAIATGTLSSSLAMCIARSGIGMDIRLYPVSDSVASITKSAFVIQCNAAQRKSARARSSKDRFPNLSIKENVIALLDAAHQFG